MTQSSDIRNTFFQECDELLEALSDGLVQIEADIDSESVDLDVVNAVFRAVHSIKGGAGAFGLETLVRFAHQFETTLDAVRSEKLIPDNALIALFQRAGDQLADLVAAARDNNPVDPQQGSDLLIQLGACLGQTEAETTSDEDEIYTFNPIALPFDLALSDDPNIQNYVIEFSPSRELYANGNEPALLFRALEELGPINVSVDDSQLPDFDQFDCTDSYLRWTIQLTSEEPIAAIQSVFEFVEGLCKLEITNTTTATTELSDEPLMVEETVANQVATSPATLARPKKEAAQQAPSGPRATVRVDLELVDKLINTVGELVINQSMLSQHIRKAGVAPSSEVGNILDAFRTLARDLQESVMAIRAQPIKPLFQRMSRIVREASDMSGKVARIDVQGEDTEVDKTVIEKLADPLTHMIRNAVDHGLEKAEERVEAGKPEIGCITLSAAHRAGRVVVEVSDDGGGINRPRVRQIAIDKGLIPGDAKLTDEEIDKLLFLPGFSTASVVSDLSGRGVGMDVVKNAIQALGGRVYIQSTPGAGTIFSISLPLTLAVLDGMIVEVAGQTMVVPVACIAETRRAVDEVIQPFGADGPVLSVNGVVVPVIDLGSAFGYRPAIADYSEAIILLIETEQHKRCALLVDQILDQRQVAIKGLESNYGHVGGIAAATILADGQIALVIDPEETIAGVAPARSGTAQVATKD